MSVKQHVFSLLLLSGMCSLFGVFVSILQIYWLFWGFGNHLWFCDPVLQPTDLFGTSALVARDFFYINAAKTWLEAQSYCREQHTDLATVDNMIEMQTLIDQVDPFYSGDVWIGLRKGAETRWGWSKGDDTIQQYSMLQTTSSTFIINGSCGAISPAGYWYPGNCFSLQRFICYDGELNRLLF